MLSTTPGLARRLACAVYESLLLGAVLFVSAFPVVPLLQATVPGWTTPLLRLWLVLVAGLYFTWFWRRGQTLAMKTWGIRLESAGGGPPTLAQAWMRFAYAGLCLAPLGLGWWLALLRRDRQFLHDRLAGTRLVLARISAAPSTTGSGRRPD
ncbi:MAG: RDD family protein [Pseudomonadota bacterium]